MARLIATFALAAGLAAPALAQTPATTPTTPTTNSAAAPKILAALPATKAARYIQIENKVRAVVRYELAASIPLVE